MYNRILYKSDDHLCHAVCDLTSFAVRTLQALCALGLGPGLRLGLRLGLALGLGLGSFTLRILQAPSPSPSPHAVNPMLEMQPDSHLTGVALCTLQALLSPPLAALNIPSCLRPKLSSCGPCTRDVHPRALTCSCVQGEGAYSCGSVDVPADLPCAGERVVLAWSAGGAADDAADEANEDLEEEQQEAEELRLSFDQQLKKRGGQEQELSAVCRCASCRVMSWHANPNPDC